MPDRSISIKRHLMPGTRHPLTPEARDVLARRFRALGDPTRVAIVNRLARGEATVGELVLELGLAQATVSHHVATLRRAGLVALSGARAPAPYRLEPHVLGDLAHALGGKRTKKLRRPRPGA
jgi:DNA-binding transcriptional ArsR family regulator